jgi:CheY-like chemotaxis protein
LSYSVLVVEDSTADARLIRLGMARCPGCSVAFAEDGEAALSTLRQGARPPDLLLLDLNLPRMSGHELLRALAQDDVLRGIPVVVFSGSPNPHDRHEAHAAGARGYVVKPSSLESFVEAVASIVKEWMDKVAPATPPAAVDPVVLSADAAASPEPDQPRPEG